MPDANGTEEQQRSGDQEAARSPRHEEQDRMGRDDEDRDLDRERDRSKSRSPSRGRSESPPRRRRRRSRSRSRDRYSDRRDSDRYDRRRSPPRRGRSPSPPPRIRGDVPKHLTMFVAGMTFICNEKDLMRKFSKYGNVLEARIVRDNHTGSSRGFGFVSMSTEEEVDAAIEGLNGREWDGRRVLVERAKRS